MKVETDRQAGCGGDPLSPTHTAAAQGKLGGRGMYRHQTLLLTSLHWKRKTVPDQRQFLLPLTTASSAYTEESALIQLQLQEGSKDTSLREASCVYLFGLHFLPALRLLSRIPAHHSDVTAKNSNTRLYIATIVNKPQLSITERRFPRKNSGNKTYFQNWLLIVFTDKKQTKC